MASFYPQKREGPVTLGAVSASLRNGASRQQAVERRLQMTPAQRTHRALVQKENRIEDVLRIAEAFPADIDASNIATAIHKGAQLCRVGTTGRPAILCDHRFIFLLKKGSDRAVEWLPRQLCHAAWSLAALRVHDESFLSAVTRSFVQRVSEGIPQDLSTVAWAYASVHCGDEPVFGSIADAAIQKMAEFGAQDLAITAWAFAKVLCPFRRPLMAAIAQKSIERLDSLGSRNLANVTWSFASAQHRDLPLWEAMASACAARATELGPQELPITLWAFAAVGYPADEVFAASGNQAIRSIDKMDSSHICNVVWAFSRAGPRNEKLFQVFACEAIRRLEEMQLLQMTNLAWSFANVSRADESSVSPPGIRHKQLFERIAHRVSKLDSEPLLPQHFASLVWAFAVCAVPTGVRLLADAHAHLFFHVELEPRLAAGVLWALASTQQSHQPLTTSILSSVAGSIDSLARDGPAHLASIAWAASNLGCHEHRNLRLALVSNVDGLCSALAGTAEELSDGRKQNIASVVRVLYAMGFADTARSLLIRMEDAEVALGQEAISDWITGAVGAGDVDLEVHLWERLMDDCCSEQTRTLANVITLQAANAHRLDLGERIANIANERKLTSMSQNAHPQEGSGGHSPRGEYRNELKFLQRVREEFSTAGTEIAYMTRGIHGQVLDLCLECVSRASGPRPFLVLDIGCGVGRSLLSATKLPQCRVIGTEADPVLAAIAMNILEHVACRDKADVWVGKGEQLMPRLLRMYGPACVSMLLLHAQGTEYFEELHRAESLGLLTPQAMIVADNVLQPFSPELLWKTCKSYEYVAVAVTIPDNWLLLARRTGLITAKHNPPDAVMALKHAGCEASWRRRGQKPASLSMDAARKAYEAAGIDVSVVDSQDNHDWQAEVAARLGILCQ